jgi:hypothetical protein
MSPTSDLESTASDQRAEVTVWAAAHTHTPLGNERRRGQTAGTDYRPTWTIAVPAPRCLQLF